MANPQPYPLERLFGRVLSPFERFLQRTTAGGIVLIATTALALALASWTDSDALLHFWEQPLAIRVGRHIQLERSLHHWINDGLMALFFLLVGLEIKREMLVGELASLKDAALPIIAALGGTVVPALIYMCFNASTPTASGWGIPMATDIAFAVGILVLLAWRIPKNLILFLTALAIVDDLAAVLVIALFYTPNFNIDALWIAVGLVALLLLLNRGGIRHPLPYALTGLALWYVAVISGGHATVAGIVLAMAIPARPAYTPTQFDRRMTELQRAFRDERDDAVMPDDPLSNHRMASIAEAIEHSATAVQSPLQRMEHALGPWVAFIVIPVFALSNAGIDLGQIQWASALSQRVTIGVTLGLVFGKVVGISVFSWIAVRLGVARLPNGVAWRHLIGAAWLGGIGFTMSLYIAQLAFDEPIYVEQAKLGILLGSAVSAVIGLVWLYRASNKKP